jgi:hypothetical protein
VGFVGCLGGLRSGSIAPRVDNRDDRRHAVAVDADAELDGGVLDEC